ncbi:MULTISPECIES: hypothetical protein [unclassified Lysobacter]|uniref:hypothetical protein n=1 Tax=unclassified Lysobacter TaxID=2635362 RepID=UPI001BE50C87|nr:MULTISPECIES: hypothetical protein [unclassified Lysobacter]MBT2747849.1 hypothetical protein [Lysobacter sp. ISL-42]MBT2753811.1 hypothetical protein [Lysobacter sp. ISL-50]MBT2779099.1 hypothetical protein [Lysobacter sp. ISL-54]
MAAIGVVPFGKSGRVVSAIKVDRLLVREAERAGKSVQASIDGLTAQLAKGNMNPGTGTKHLFNGVFEARALDGARVYFRHVEDGVEIVGKSSKENQPKVIQRLRDIYEKK